MTEIKSIAVGRRGIDARSSSVGAAVVLVQMSRRFTLEHMQR